MQVMILKKSLQPYIWNLVFVHCMLSAISKLNDLIFNFKKAIIDLYDLLEMSIDYFILMEDSYFLSNTPWVTVNKNIIRIAYSRNWFSIGSYLKTYSGNKPAVFYKANTVMLKKLILQRKRKTQKKHYLMQSWVLLLCFRSVVLYSTWANSSPLVVQFKHGETWHWYIQRKRTWKCSVMLVCSKLMEKSL